MIRDLWRRVSYVRDGFSISTRGMARHGKCELRVAVDTVDLIDEAYAFLRHVVDYTFRSKRTISADETMNHGYWFVKFVALDSVLDVWEYNADATSFVPGASLTLRYWKEQDATCRTCGAPFRPPRADQLTAMSAGVFDGLPVQARRYPWPEHMSGWLLVTERYDGNVESLTNEHTYHITARRPELVKYLALPPGFGFDTNGERIFFDEEVAAEARTSTP